MNTSTILTVLNRILADRGVEVVRVKEVEHENREQLHS